MHIAVFGNGPLPVELHNAVTAPGARTWQIARTAALALSQLPGGPHTVSIVALDDRPSAQPFSPEIPGQKGQVSLRYLPLNYDRFVNFPRDEDNSGEVMAAQADAVVGCASVQPYSTAAAFAARRNLPLWIDVFGDPLCEWQSQAATAGADTGPSQVQQVHVWKLFLDALVAGDRFSTLSVRQRYALLGQLGCAGRLNQYTAAENLAASIPYGIFADEVPEIRKETSPLARFNILWCGSFNTWMDVPTLARGIIDAMRQNPQIRLTVVGGQITGYNEISYKQFVEAIKNAGLTGSVQLLDWQPIGAMPKLYAEAHLGLSIDRICYEAYLGSRTRIVNFMAYGLPVASTAASELTEALSANKLLLKFNLGDSASLTHTLLTAAANADSLGDLGNRCRRFVLENYSAPTVGRPLIDWLKNPALAADHILPTSADGLGNRGNDLISNWQKLRQKLNSAPE